MSTFAVPVTLDTVIVFSSFDEKSLWVPSPISRRNVLEKQLQFWISHGEGGDGPLSFGLAACDFAIIPGVDLQSRWHHGDRWLHGSEDGLESRGNSLGDGGCHPPGKRALETNETFSTVRRHWCQLHTRKGTPNGHGPSPDETSVSTRGCLSLPLSPASGSESLP